LAVADIMICLCATIAAGHFVKIVLAVLMQPFDSLKNNQFILKVSIVDSKNIRYG
jgi:hypothetical protein